MTNIAMRARVENIWAQGHDNDNDHKRSFYGKSLKLATVSHLNIIYLICILRYEIKNIP